MLHSSTITPTYLEEMWQSNQRTDGEKFLHSVVSTFGFMSAKELHEKAEILKREKRSIFKRKTFQSLRPVPSWVNQWT